MAISYNKLWKLLIDKKMTQAELRKAADIAPNTMTKLRRDEPVNLATLGRACAATVMVQISPTFWGWLFQFAGQMRILSPDNVISDYKKHAAMLDE